MAILTSLHSATYIGVVTDSGYCDQQAATETQKMLLTLARLE